MAPAPGTLKKRIVLIDPRFQIKYTAMLVLVVAAVTAGLGFVIRSTTNTATGYAQIATAEAEKAMKESQANSQLTRQNVVLAASDNPDLMKEIEGDLTAADQKAARDLAEVQTRKVEIENQRKLVMTVLIAGGVAVVLLLTVMGMYITRRVVGPVHKMKRLLRRVGTGRLVVNERLRRDDELADLFDTFLQMVWSLKALQNARLATLEATLKKAEAQGAPKEVLEGLRALRAQMVLGFGGKRA